MLIKLLIAIYNQRGQMKKHQSSQNLQQNIFMAPYKDKKIHVFVDNPKGRIISRTSPKPQSKLSQKTGSQPLEQLNLHLRMKQKFQELYKKIKKISNTNNEQIKGKVEKRYILGPNDEISKRPIHYLQGIKNELSKIKSKSVWDDITLQKKLEFEQKNLQVNTMPTPIKNDSKQDIQIRMMKSSRYNKPLLSPIKKSNMSNNIRDYLSVQKIKIKEAQQNLLGLSPTQVKSKELDRKNSEISHLHEGMKTNKTMKEIVPFTNPKYDRNLLLKPRKFTQPFDTYYYRDMIWRVGFSNEEIVKSPPEYEQKVRIYIGRGNNSRLIRSIVNKRSWYQVSERIEESSVVWTQLKVQSAFASQKPNKRELPMLKVENEQSPYVKNRIWSEKEEKKFKSYFSSFSGAQQRMDETMKFRNKSLKVNLKDVQKVKVHNHLINNYIIGNKKALFQTMSQYYKIIGENVFQYLPLTFHICNGIEDDEYLKFLQYFYAINKENRNENQPQKMKKNQKYNAWILKPGQDTNRGQGITVCLNLQSIKNTLKTKTKHNDGSLKTYILQKYIEKPFLYKKRKFDIRQFIMINCSNGMIKGYWFKDGYARTTSSQYTLKQGGGNIHLTNDAVQKQLPEYGKYQKGNKISYEQISEYMHRVNPKYDFWKKVYPKMKKISTDVIKASANNLDPQRRKNNFEIFGLDFMLDDRLNVWLIEVNTNPCLQISCPLLMKIIPPLIQNTFQIAIDPQYPPPTNFSPKGMYFKGNILEEMRYELVYDERLQMENNSGADLLNDEKLMKEEQDMFEDDGEDIYV